MECKLKAHARGKATGIQYCTVHAGVQEEGWQIKDLHRVEQR
jgi:hypothetical protein